RSSGALSIASKDVSSVFVPASDRTFVIAAVSVVLPWSIWPIVPTLTCGLVRSNFCFAICSYPPSSSCWGLRCLVACHDCLCDGGLYFLVAVELHRERRTTLAHGAHVRRIPEHLRERNARADRLRRADRLELLAPATTTVQVTNDIAEVLVRRDDLDGHDGLEELRLRALHAFL